jgi:hypothetical protein
VVRRILDLSLVSELPQRLTNQFEWHEFAPLGFLLIQSFSPQRVLEVGTTIGDSYLSFCQAVTACNLSTERICIPVSKAGHDAKGEPPGFKEFRTYHDALYAKFSAIDSAAKGISRIDSEHRKFDTIHLVSPKSPDELDAICSTWLPRLRASGVALISGPGQLEHSRLSSCLKKVSAPYCNRILQMEHWIAIQLVFLRQMAKLAHRGFVRHRLLPQIDAYELPQHRRAVLRLLHPPGPTS